MSEQNDLLDLRNRTHDEHDRAAELRDHASDRTDEAAELRDAASDLTDEVADLRDELSDSRDRVARHRQNSLAAAAGSSGTADFRVSSAGAAADRAESSRLLAAEDRREAAADRARARADRVSAATDRSNARRDRELAAEDRRRAAQTRHHAENDCRHAAKDGLTGAYLRAPGLELLERSVTRAKDDGHPLAIMFIDIDNLKLTNDRLGHAAGDRMILDIAATLRASLRPDDIVFRYGGDEFVCVLPGIETSDALLRVSEIHRALALATHGGSVSIGLGQLQPHHDMYELIAVADKALYRNRTRAASKPTAQA